MLLSMIPLAFREKSRKFIFQSEITYPSLKPEASVIPISYPTTNRINEPILTIWYAAV